MALLPKKKKTTKKKSNKNNKNSKSKKTYKISSQETLQPGGRGHIIGPK